MVPFSYVQPRFVEARLIREADCELKKQLKNMFLISFYLFLPISFCFAIMLGPARNVVQKLQKWCAKIFALPFCKESYKSVLEKAKSFWCDVGGAWRHAAQAHHRQEKKMNRELWGQETFHNMAFTAGLRNKEIKACNGVFLLKL